MRIKRKLAGAPWLCLAHGIPMRGCQAQGSVAQGTVTFFQAPGLQKILFHGKSLAFKLMDSQNNFSLSESLPPLSFAIPKKTAVFTTVQICYLRLTDVWPLQKQSAKPE